MSAADSATDPPFDWQTRFLGSYHDDLPHWVVERGRYAVTFRCAGTLPKAVVARMEEQRRLLGEVLPQSEEAENARRRLFLALETYLDKGYGFAPFRDTSVAKSFHTWLSDYRLCGERLLSDFVIMPNHLHLVTREVKFESTAEFRKTWSQFKGRSAFFLNRLLKRTGPFWQT